MTAQHSQPRLVVGVGASAGGLEAFKKLLAALPSEPGMAFVLVQHLDPHHTSLLAELLGPCTGMTVVEADHQVELRSNTVYVIPPDTSLAIRAGHVELSRPTLHRGVRLPVDHLFRSLAHEYGPRAVGIVLSGAGSDGSSGLREIKAAGGLAVAQDPSSSGQPGMPESAIDTGVVDLVLSIGEMPAALERFANLPSKARLLPPTAPEEKPESVPGPALELDKEALTTLAAVLRAHLDFDVSVYKAGTVERRVFRRMLLSGFGDVAEYLEHLRSDSEEQQALVRDLLIGVTDFFRDPNAFRALRETVIDRVVQDLDEGSTIRIWVPGCATGEEAYSIAIETIEAIEGANKRLSMQVFATDIDNDALAVGRAGLYPPTIAEHVSSSRLAQHFARIEGRGYQVHSQTRDAVSFAVHDLTKDPPFSRMHLVSCRNLLIYLTADAQKHVLKLLHFALEPNGYLFLSTSESTGGQRQLFATVSKSARIYRKVGQSRPIAIERSSNRRHARETGSHPRPGPPPGDARPARGLGGNDLARQAVLKARVPPSVIVANDDRVMFMHGELSPFLRFPEGDHPRLDLAALLRPELATRARGALYKARRAHESVVAVSSLDGTPAPRTRITATPISELGDEAVLLSFEPLHEPSQGEAAPHSQGSGDESLIRQLETELNATRDDLRNAVEELETANEQLRSSNEESMSMNEELQSANEELEATTEELRSLNEELTTVNAQLREKVEQLEQANDDLNNFFASAKVATIFLDERLCIKRFTPTAGELLGLDSGDEGRFVGNIAHELLQLQLEAEARSVLEHLATNSRELHIRDGRWVKRRVLPYRTESRHIEGVVVTFQDVTDLKTATERAALRERQQAAIARIGLLALKTPDLQGFMDQAVREMQATLHTDFCEILELQPDGERLLLRAGVGWKDETLRFSYVAGGANSQAGYTLQASEPVIVSDLATEERFTGPPLLVDHGVVSGMSCVIRDGEHEYGVLGAHSTTARSFATQDARFLQAIAGVVGSAIGRHQTRKRLAIELSIAHALSEPADLDDALRRVLDCLALELRTEVGEVWWPNGSGDMLTCHLRRVTPREIDRRVNETLGDDPVRSGEGLVGRVFKQGKALWCTDLAGLTLDAHGERARQLGLVSAFGIPIRSSSGVLGVVSVFSHHRLFADEVFLHSLGEIGRSIAEFIARLEVEQRSLRLAAITESSHDAILSYGYDGLVVEWLVGAEQLFGYTADEMVGNPIETIVPEGRREELWMVNARIKRGEVVEPFETIRRCKDGRIVEVSVRSSPVKDRNGNVVGISSTDRDVTRLKETEHQLLEADRQKDEFLAMLGHELRNPLAAIRNASELLKLSCGDNPGILRTQAVLERQSAHMAKLIDGLLDVSRIISGKIVLEPEVVDLGAFCREVITEMAQRAEARGMRLGAEIPSQPLWVRADPVRLTQILDNLLSNALKYTSDGGEITLELQRDDEEAVLTIRDTGMGIDADLLPLIFDVFRQSKQTLDRSKGGLGLGLALVKSLVELHRGSIEAASDGADRGSTFTVRLPATNKAPARTNGSGRAREGSLHILVIEDNEDAAEMLRLVLERSGHRVCVANCGQEGVELAKRERPDVVLCDIGLPGGMTGFDVAVQLRADPDQSDLRLIALSGYGRTEDKERGRQSGFDAHMTKPVDVKSLEQVLRDVRPGREAR